MPKMSLKTKMSGTIALLVALSLAVVALSIYVPLQSTFRKLMRNNVAFVAGSKSDQLHAILSSAESALQAMAGNEAMRTTTDKDGSASRALREMLFGMRGTFSRVMLVDGSGVVVAASDRTMAGKRIADLWRDTEISSRYRITADSNLETYVGSDQATLAMSHVVESTAGTSLALVGYLNWSEITQQLLGGGTGSAANEQSLLVLLNGHGKVLGGSRQLTVNRTGGAAQSLQDVGVTLDTQTDPATAPDADLELTLADQHYRGRSVEVHRDLHWALVVAHNAQLLDGDLHSVRNSALVLVLVMLGLCVGVGYRLATNVSDSLLKLVPAFEKLATGNLDCLLETSSADEIAHISKQFNEFVERLRSIVTNIIDSTHTLTDSSRLLADLSKSLVSNAQETSSQASSASQISDEVSTNINTVSAGVEEMSLSINEIARSSDEAARVATSAVRIAEMTNTTVQELGGSSSEIGNVIKVINSIAEQTNLLALNATIEAARAGEAGKGFAVVANEVKELAKETARATEDIGKKIEAIQAKTKGAVSAIGEIGSIINQVNDYQTTIASAVQEQLATTTEIGRNIAEVAERSYMITKNITAVAQFAQSASSGASDTQEASSAVSRISADLHRVVEAFRYTR